MADNLYYEDLKKNDDTLSSLETEYDLLLSQFKDRKLKKLLKGYWDTEDINNSMVCFQRMVINDKYEIKPEARNKANRLGKFNKRRLKPIAINEVMQRIDELLDGAPDE